MNRVTHFEIYTPDPEAVEPFYRDVFGWKFQKFESGPIEYWLVTTGDDNEPGINGGITRPREGQSPGTINTVAVKSLDQTIKKIEERGGKSACRKRRSRKSAGSRTPKTRPGTSLELSNQIRKRNKKYDYKN